MNVRGAERAEMKFRDVFLGGEESFFGGHIVISLRGSSTRSEIHDNRDLMKSKLTIGLFEIPKQTIIIFIKFIESI